MFYSNHGILSISELLNFMGANLILILDISMIECFLIIKTYGKIINNSTSSVNLNYNRTKFATNNL